MPNEGEEVQPKFHKWQFRMDRESIPTQFDFPSPVTKREAADRIAKHYGAKELPSTAVISQRHLEPLATPEEVEATDNKEPQKESAGNDKKDESGGKRSSK